jgi:ATP-dependent protease ClpP protease subunit
VSETNKTALSDGDKFFILGQFDEALIESIVVPLTKKIDDLAKVRDAKLTITINSPGGDGYIVMHIVQLLELAKAKGITVQTVVPQVAFSAGSILAVAGAEGHRYIGRTGEHLIHYGSIWSRSLTPLQVERQAEYQKRWFAKLLGHYERYAKIPDLATQIKDDNFFIASADCIKWKLADKYMDEL